MSQIKLSHHLSSLRTEVDGALDRFLPEQQSPPHRLHEAMRYCVFAGGKRIRPLLVLLAGEALGASRQSLLPGAVSVEMIHTFSLVHDDLPALDDDDLRRGRETVHKRYDEALAVLVGDALLNLGLTLLAKHPGEVERAVRGRAVEVIGDAVGTLGMIGGQVADLEAEGGALEGLDHDAAARQLEQIHRCKTGALIAASLRLGGIYAGATQRQERRLETLGYALGQLFQITDDILDVTASSEMLGKTAGKDERANKLTYPSLFGLERSRELAAAYRDKALQTLDGLGERTERLEQFIHYVAQRQS